MTRPVCPLTTVSNCHYHRANLVWATGLFINDATGKVTTNEMRNVDQYNRVSHTSQRVSRPSQTPHSCFTQNVPLEKFATVSPLVTHNWRKWR